jgi:hypothetical protein
MTKQQVTPEEDFYVYITGIPSGQKLRDGHTFLLCRDWYFMVDGEPVELENGATYIVEFPFTNHGPHPDVERMFALYEKGFWYSFSGDDATISVEDADYRVIRKVDLWAA